MESSTRKWKRLKFKMKKSWLFRVN